MKNNIQKLHQDVPSNHYDQGVKNNIFQKFWHQKRINEIKKVMPLNIGNTLDIGCHSAFLTEQIIADSSLKKLYGIDISNQAIKLAKKRIKHGSFAVGDIHKLSFKKNYFDTIICTEVLEHIEDPTKALTEVHRILKKTGIAIILVPTDSILFKIIWAIWNELHPIWKHTHIQSFKTDRLPLLLKKQNFKIKFQKKFNLGMLLLIVAEK